MPATGVWLFPEAPAPQLVDLIRHAERLGLDEFWLGDEGPAREPFSVLAAAAVKTERIRLAVGVTNPFVRHPGLAATSMLTIHELSGGRAILGVGAGGQMSLGPFGLTAERPLQRIEKFISIVRAVADREETEDYRPPDTAIDAQAAGGALPIYIGGRGPKINTLASRVADGAFVAGLPPFRYSEVIGWARSVRSVDVALYPSVAFDEAAIEDHRPEMIWSLVDAPPETREALGISAQAIEHAATALRAGDARPARHIVTDDVLEEIMVVGDPVTVGRRLADLVVAHQPNTIGLALLQRDLVGGIDDAARAFSEMRQSLRGAAS